MVKIINRKVVIFMTEFFFILSPPPQKKKKFLLLLCYRASQEESITLLCKVPINACKSIPTVADVAKVVAEKHRALLTQYGDCHRRMNAAHVFSDEELSDLGKSPRLMKHMLRNCFEEQ